VTEKGIENIGVRTFVRLHWALCILWSGNVVPVESHEDFERRGG